MAPPRLPRAVRVSSVVYRVIRQKRVSLGGKPCDGVTDLEACTIRIQTGLSADRAWQVLDHELFHAAWRECGADETLSRLDFRDTVQRGFGEEWLAHSFTPVYCAALKAARSGKEVDGRSKKGSRSR